MESVYLNTVINTVLKFSQYIAGGIMQIRVKCYCVSYVFRFCLFSFFVFVFVMRALKLHVSSRSIRNCQVSNYSNSLCGRGAPQIRQGPWRPPVPPVGQAGSGYSQLVYYNYYVVCVLHTLWKLTFFVLLLLFIIIFSLVVLISALK